MAKQKRKQTESENGVTYSPAMEPFDPAPEARWGYGFERKGSKWRAYKTGPDLTYLSPDRGEELHSAVARIQSALGKEIALALRSRS